MSPTRLPIRLLAHIFDYQQDNAKADVRDLIDGLEAHEQIMECDLKGTPYTAAHMKVIHVNTQKNINQLLAEIVVFELAKRMLVGFCGGGNQPVSAETADALDRYVTDQIKFVFFVTEEAIKRVENEYGLQCRLPSHRIVVGMRDFLKERCAALFDQGLVEHNRD